MDRDQYVEVIKEIRAMLASDVDAPCSCPKTKCEWHGNCYACVRIHRHYSDHVPNCLQHILKDKVQAIARAAEMTAEKKPMTPDEYWDYVREVAPLDNEDQPVED
ncbi:MAG: hypothetical protein WCJ56_03215 [bacterium]